MARRPDYACWHLSRSTPAYPKTSDASALVTPTAGRSTTVLDVTRSALAKFDPRALTGLTIVHTIAQ